MAIKVRCTHKGVYGHVRNPGDEFEIADEKAFSERWMERVESEDVKVKVSTKAKAAAKNN